jgi:hypothetical protein
MDIRILKPRKALNKAFMKAKPKRSEIEAEIDQLVYQLYGLTPEEMEVVENSAG